MHYAVSKKDQKVDLTASGFKFAEQIVGKSLFDLADPWAFYVVNAIKVSVSVPSSLSLSLSLFISLETNNTTKRIND